MFEESRPKWNEELLDFREGRTVLGLQAAQGWVGASGVLCGHGPGCHPLLSGALPSLPLWAGGVGGAAGGASGEEDRGCIPAGTMLLGLLGRSPLPPPAPHAGASLPYGDTVCVSYLTLIWYWRHPVKIIVLVCYTELILQSEINPLANVTGFRR